MRLVFVFCCIYSVLSDVEQLTWIRNRAFDDITINDDVMFSLYDVTNALSCGTECSKNPKCKSFSYNSHNRTCRLHSVAIETAGSSDRCPGSRLYSIRQDAPRCPVEEGYVYFENVTACFKAITEKASWVGARDNCSQSGSRLIVLDNGDKNDVVSNYVSTNIGNTWYYVGLSDIDTEGAFVWVNGKTAGFTKWKKIPNANNTNENCVVLIVKTNNWNDVTCSNPQAYICEIPL